MSESVAFLCLGRMGYPMAGHLARSGHRVRVYNRTRSVADAWIREFSGAGTSLAETPADAAREADIVFACAGNDDDLRSVALASEGALSGMKPGALFVDHTTVSARIAREIAAAAVDRQCAALDAPVSGGEAGAQRGELTIMVGGEAAAFERAEPVWACYAKKTLLMGPAGSGQLTKMVNQVCIAGVIQGLSEGLHFALRSGLDPARVVEVISQGAAQSWQMDNRAQSMVEGRFDFGFAVDWMRKDLAIALDQARAVGARLPVAALVDQLYAEVQSAGGGRLDTSSLIQLLEPRELEPQLETKSKSR